MKTFKEFKRMVDEDAAAISSGPTNVSGGIVAGIGVLPQDQPSNKNRKKSSKSPILFKTQFSRKL